MVARLRPAHIELDTVCGLQDAWRPGLGGMRASGRGGLVVGGFIGRGQGGRVGLQWRSPVLLCIPRAAAPGGSDGEIEIAPCHLLFCNGKTGQKRSQAGEVVLEWEKDTQENKRERLTR